MKTRDGNCRWSALRRLDAGKNCVTRTAILLVYWILDCCFRRSEFNKTRTSTFLSYSIGISSLPSSPLWNHQKPWKFKHAGHLHWNESFVFSSCRCSKRSVSCLLIMNWSEHFIQWGFFQICSGNINTSLLFYAFEDMHLINKVQE